MSENRTAGRPLKFQSVEELKKKIEAYFRECDREEDTRIFEHARAVEQEYEEYEKGKRVIKRRLVCERCFENPAWSRGCRLISGEWKQKKPYTVTGLAVWLDTSRQTLLEYEGEVEGREHDVKFADAIKRAKQRIENYAEESLYDKEKPTRGVIFSLSNNAEGWTEKKQTDLNVKRDGAADLAAVLLDEAAEPVGE